MEDAAIAGERDDALLDACTGAVVQSDDRCTNLECQVHQLVDLFGEDFAKGTAEDGEVLAEHEHLAAVDRAPTGDHAVGVWALLEAGGVCTVSGE